VLCLFDEMGRETQVPLQDRDAIVGTPFLPGVRTGQSYCYRALGPVATTIRIVRIVFCGINGFPLLMAPRAIGRDQPRSSSPEMTTTATASFLTFDSK